jgi:hypothetical protein
VGSDRRATIEALIRAVLAHLAHQHGAPRIDALPDNRRWWRHGPETFVGLQPRGWDMPDEVPVHGWLDKTFPEMQAVRESYAADPRFGPRVDAMIGTEFHRQGRNFDWLLIEQLLRPLVLTTGSYTFDAAAFDTTYQRLDTGFGADEVHLVEFLPLNGFDSTDDTVALPDGMTLRRMTDTQMSEAINQLAVTRSVGPDRDPGLPGRRRTRRPGNPHPADVPDPRRTRPQAGHGAADRVRWVGRGEQADARPRRSGVPARPRHTRDGQRVRQRRLHPTHRADNRRRRRCAHGLPTPWV